MAEEHKGEHAGHEGGGHGGGGHGGGHKGGHGGGGGHAEGEHEGAPEWLISFADNVALMMGFFVILLAMNMAKPKTGGVGGEGKYPSDTPSEVMTDFAIAMRAAFKNPVSPDSNDPSEAELVKRVRALSKEGGQTSQHGVDGKDNSLQAPRTTDWVKPYGFASFLEFDAQINEEGKKSMAEAAEELKGQQWIVEVRGHVSAIESRDNPERAMRLGFERSWAAAQELVKAGMDLKHLRIVSCADNERTAPRADSADGHRSNQRVEVVQTQEPVPGDPFNGANSGGGGGEAAGHTN